MIVVLPAILIDAVQNQAGSRGEVTLCGRLGKDFTPPRYDRKEVAMGLRNW